MESNGRPTILDVAAAAKLGKTTASDVLRQRPGYSPKTRARVIEAARRLGYRPDYHGRALRGGRTMSLGVLGASPEGAASQPIIRGVELAARQQGYVTYSVGWGDADKTKAVRHVEELIDRRVDGIVYYSPSIGPPTQPVKVLAAAQVPVVYIGWAPAKAKYAVRIDRLGAIHEMARYLAGLGHRSAALASSLFVQKNPDMKLNAYREAFSKAGIDLDTSEGWMIPPDDEHAGGAYRLVQRRIERGRLPTVLLMNGDLQAAEALAACHDAGLRVPTDLSVVGFNDEPLADVLRPSLTTIHMPREEAGYAAFELLQVALGVGAAPREPLAFSCRFIPRQSTAPPRGGKV